MPAHLRSTLLAAAVLATAGLAVPAAAQTVEELTVTGHALRNNPQSLSETVSYADLDLTQASQRAILNARVTAAAGRVCDRLNEARPHAGNLGHSCQEVAVRNASDQVRLAFADARNMARLASAAPAAGSYSSEASAVVPTGLSASPPVPDTRANRARYGGPMSHAGRRTAPAGN
jgi:UrcA family protein